MKKKIALLTILVIIGVITTTAWLKVYPGYKAASEKLREFNSEALITSELRKDILFDNDPELGNYKTFVSINIRDVMFEKDGIVIKTGNLHHEGYGDGSVDPNLDISLYDKNGYEIECDDVEIEKIDNLSNPIKGHINIRTERAEDVEYVSLKPYKNNNGVDLTLWMKYKSFNPYEE